MPLPSLAGAPVSVLQHTASIVTGLAIVDGGRRLASCDRDEKVRVSRWPTTCLIDSFCLGHTEYVAAVAVAHVNPTTELLASISGDGSLRCWHLATGACLATHAFGDRAVPVALATTPAAASSAGVAVAVAGSPTVAVFGLAGVGEASGGAALTLREVTLPSSPSALAFAADGRLLALGPTPPYLHCVTSGDARLVVAPSTLAAALTKAIEERALKVRTHTHFPNEAPPSRPTPFG